MKGLGVVATEERDLIGMDPWHRVLRISDDHQKAIEMGP